MTISPSIAARLAIALVLVALLPSDLWAWTPGTHILLGEAVLRAAALLPPAIAALLQAHPRDFLYGSIAADTSVAKKYAAPGRHCHSWTVGYEILEEAKDDPLRAFAYGYLAHLAADAVAHNHFVPFQLAVTASTTAIGHSYWESRFETHLSPVFPKRAHDLILLDHARSDGHLDRILSPTIFSTPTNRRIFRGMVVVTDSDSWQRVFGLLAQNSRWDLAEADVGRYLVTSFDFVMDLFTREGASAPMRLDPAGEEALRDAKRVRRTAKKDGDEAVHSAAVRQFGLPREPLGFAQRLGSPLYAPRSARI